ncbi:anti-sigma factor [uncultured Alsobacter sp.]|uniref:anti-sigma factor family protein n=1 Tax=uncultured Alsobacter sp. TaxID=1748258 RepID=UPI0026002A32|nr:zf-HC2 domain-containing protein [uncultured Alsobacter sp.]
MTCRDVSRRASTYLDEDLSLRERLALKAHLFICVNCRRYVAQLAATLNLVRDRQWAGVDEEAEDRLAAMFRQSGKSDGGSGFTCT